MALSMKSLSTDASRRSASTMQRYRSNSIEQVDIDIQQQDQQHTHIQDQDCNCDYHRRGIILTTLTSAIISLSGAPTLAAATENDSFEAPMNGLTRQIRTSVVKGAQVIDKLDSKWERFSDDFGLGDKRNQPKRNVIDAGGNERSKKVVQSQSNDGGILLDEVFADNLLKRCDEMNDTTNLLRKSFFKASSIPANAQEEFNFNCYVHFRVYNEILVREKVFFPSFKNDFEASVGKLILKSTLKEQPSLLQDLASETTLNERLTNALVASDTVATLLQNKGLIDTWERSIPPDDDIEDWTTTSRSTTSDNFYVSSDLEYSLALNGDVTLNSQLLLQELGYRLYPSFGRWLVHEAVLQCFGSENKVKVNMDDYYMDTSYNSNPDLFE
eukprot:scaffold21148_cov157-Skeletonema_marinoi.AAC.1